jgi:hypothetical protein
VTVTTVRPTRAPCAARCGKLGVPTPAKPCDFCEGEGWWPDGKPCPDGMHRWVGKQMGGPPDDAVSAEWVEVCDVCGAENPGSGVIR